MAVEKKFDIVYVLKNDIDPSELRYSLRSVVENFPYNRIVFYGGSPQGIKPDLSFPLVQIGSTKYDKARSSWVQVMDNDELTEDIWVFNDDFFIMKKWEYGITPLCNGTLYQVIIRIESSRGGKGSLYTKRLRDTSEKLHEIGCDIISFESHTPLLVNRQKAKYIYDNFYGYTFRSVYGNFYKINGILKDDVKIVKVDVTPDDDIDLLSTNEKSFSSGIVGDLIRDRFNSKCKYEVE